MSAAPDPAPWLSTAFAGACATLVGVGLQRFAYAPLLPAMVRGGWLGPGAAGALAGVNFAGYLAGALLAGRIGQRLGTVRTLRLAMLVAALCFALCAHDGGLAWFVPWRALAGLAGGVLMGLAGPLVQATVPLARRGLASGAVFAGVGLGIVLGAMIVPALLPQGLPAAWMALAAAALALAAAAWRCWPPARPPAAPRGPATGVLRLPGAVPLVLSYALSAAAATPVMVFWPDFVVRGLGRSAALAGLLWAVYGLAGAAGPVLCGRAADRLGVLPAFRVTLALQVVALALPLASHGLPALLVASALAGATALGTTGLALVRAREVAGEAAPALWRLSTAGWAAAQLGSGFALAWLYAATGTHAPLFAVGAGLAALALPALGRARVS